jgi:hypothetical protein
MQLRSPQHDRQMSKQTAMKYAVRLAVRLTRHGLYRVNSIDEGADTTAESGLRAAYPRAVARWWQVQWGWPSVGRLFESGRRRRPLRV